MKNQTINLRESKVKKTSVHGYIAAAAVLMCFAAVAQDITVGQQPDLVVGKAIKKAEPAALVAAQSLPVPAPVLAPALQWSVEIKDVTLANTFSRWATAAGWRVRWDAAKNVMVEAPDTVTGSFEDAVEAQLASPGIAHSSYPLEVCFYPNTPPLARITRKGDQDKECK